MPHFLKLGDLWINADQITEIHIETTTDGTPKGCKIKLLGESVRELSGEKLIAAVLAFLHQNEVKPSRQKGK